MKLFMEPGCAHISVKGRLIKVPATRIEDHTIIATGGWLKIAEIFDEPWQLQSVRDPAAAVSALKKDHLGADIFTFSQKLPETQPQFPYAMVWDNVAAVSITSYDEWWEKLPQETRKNVRRAGKRGVEVRSTVLDDALVQGIKRIYDETPMRQGRRFWHYGKDLEAIKRENSSYLERCEFVGAFVEGELIGFLKMVYIGKTARIMQILSQNSHHDKRPMNALLAKAMEICAAKGMSHFVYGQYIYGNNNEASIIEFKRRNGFEQILLPKYYVPLTWKGAAAIKLGLHLGLRRLLPRKLENGLLALRARFLQRRMARQRVSGAEMAAA